MSQTMEMMLLFVIIPIVLPGLGMIGIAMLEQWLFRRRLQKAINEMVIIERRR